MGWDGEGGKEREGRKTKMSRGGEGGRDGGLCQLARDI